MTENIIVVKTIIPNCAYLARILTSRSTECLHSARYMEVRTSSQESRWDKDAEILSLPRSKAKITPDHGDNTDNDSGKKPLFPALVASEHRSRDLAHIRKIKHEYEKFARRAHQALG